MLDFWLIVHFVGLAFGVGASLAMFRLRLAARDMAPADRAEFMRRASVLSKNGGVGLLLLILSGAGLVIGRGVDVVMAWGGPMFHIKLTLVVILMGLFGYMQVLMRKSRGPDGAAATARIPVVSSIVLWLGLSIIVFAVLAFH
jgi:uncharacterized membrane protein